MASTVFFSRSIQLKITAVLSVVTLLVFLFYGFPTYFSTKSSKTSVLNTMLERVADRMVVSLAYSIGKMDKNGIDLVINSEMEEKNIFAIVVRESNGESIILAKKRNADWQAINTDEEISENHINIQKNITKGEEIIGIVEVYISTKFLDEELSQIRFSLIIFFVFLTFFISLTGYILTGILIVKPSKNIIELINKLKMGDLSARAQANENEIGQVILAINSFGNDLQTAILNINDTMKSVAEGNLSRQITVILNGDLNNLKSNINEFIKMLGQTISEVVHASDQVKTNALEISNSANSLADGTTKQAASLEEISSSISEFESQTKANNDNASQAQQLSGQSLEIVQRGNSQMDSMLTAINGINDTSSEVSKVIKVIDEIAFQTNLLALNAAVEAARAGKYGKGFAVVAEEVRNLASRSADAAKNTTDLIENSLKEVEKGVNNADQTAAILNDISVSIDKNNDLVGEISSASQEQSSGIEEINKGLSQVNEVVQYNSSISEETASAAEELSNQANQLQQMMSRFKTNKQTRHIELENESINQPVKLENESISQAVIPTQHVAPQIEQKNRKLPDNTKTIVLDDDNFGKY